MEMSNLRCLSIVIVILSVINSVVNEQPKPLMGYTTEFGYKCDVSCIKTPENCIGESTVISTLKALYSNDFIKAGYNNFGLSGCNSRINFNQSVGTGLEIEPRRYPNGLVPIKKLVEKTKMRLGIVGVTCPDVSQITDFSPLVFQRLNIDYLQCINRESYTKQELYNLVQDGDSTAIIYCDGEYVDAKERAITKQQCSITGELNSRNSKPYIQESVHQIIDSLRTYNSNYRPIEVSNSSADDNNVITKFVVRAIQGKPLLITGKIRDMTKKQKKVLLNPNLIALHQDVLGNDYKEVLNNEEVLIYTREILPMVDGQKSLAIVVQNRINKPVKMTYTLTALGLKHKGGYNLMNLFDKVLMPKEAGEKIDIRVPANGIIALKLAPMKFKPGIFCGFIKLFKIETNFNNCYSEV